MIRIVQLIRSFEPVLVARVELDGEAEVRLSFLVPDMDLPDFDEATPMMSSELRKLGNGTYGSTSAVSTPSARADMMV